MPKDDKHPLVVQKRTWVGHRPRTVVVEPLSILYLVSEIPLMTIRPQYMYQKVAEYMHVDLQNLTDSNATSKHGNCDVNTSDPSFILRESVQAETANWQLYVSMATFLPGFVAPLIYGAISDRIGRRYMFIFPTLGSLISTLLYTAMVYFDWPIYFFFLQVVEFMLGGM